MANNVRLDQPALVAMALMHLPESAFKGPSTGAILALLSPSLNTIRNETNPFYALNKNGGQQNVALTAVSGDFVLSVTSHFFPEDTGLSRTTRTAAGGTVGSNGVNSIVQAATPVTVTYDKVHETEIEHTFVDYEILKSQVFLDYVSKISSGTINLKNGNPGGNFSFLYDQFTQLGMSILSYTNSAILAPLNNVCLTELLSGVGKNAASPTASSPSVAAPFPQVACFKSDGQTPSAVFGRYIANVIIKNRIKGKVIVVGGNKLLDYFNTKEIVTVAQTGFILDKIINNTRIEFYYDDNADAIFGQNKIVMFDTEAICMNTWMKHGKDPRVNPVTYNYDGIGMYYGNASINMSQYSNELLNAEALGNSKGGSFMLDFDTRTLSKRTNKDYAIGNFVVSLNYGFFKRPRGFYKRSSSEFFYDYTGIMGVELIDEA